MRRTAIMIVVLLLVSAGFAHARAPRIGEPVPTFALPDLSGKKVDSAGFKGKTTVLYFWNNLCGCTEQLIALKGFVAARKSRGLNFVAINEGQKKEIIESVITANGLPYLALSDKGLAVGKETFGIKVLPTIFIVDRSGVVREKLIGILDNRKLESLVLKYM